MFAISQVLVAVVLMATGLPPGAQNCVGGINIGLEAVHGARRLQTQTSPRRSTVPAGNSRQMHSLPQSADQGSARKSRLGIFLGRLSTRIA